MRGFDADIVPSRGFDIGDVYFRGIPISWFSPIRNARSIHVPHGSHWLSRFNGGLMTTCGLSNIGPASGAEGLHGDFSHLPARDITWRSLMDPEEWGIEVTATVESLKIFGDSFTLKRTIRSTLGSDDAATLRVLDVVKNVGPQAAYLSALYHVNFGAPLVAPGTRISIDAEKWRSRDSASHTADPSIMPEPTDAGTEAVFEHLAVTADSDGFAAATIHNPGLGIQAKVSWRLSGLPRLYQWVLPTRGRWALGIEPSTAALFGETRGQVAGAGPLLEPGQEQHLELEVSILETGWQKPT
jgi:hypothetical protein